MSVEAALRALGACEESFDVLAHLWEKTPEEAYNSCTHSRYLIWFLYRVQASPYRLIGALRAIVEKSLEKVGGLPKVATDGGTVFVKSALSFIRGWETGKLKREMVCRRCTQLLKEGEQALELQEQRASSSDAGRERLVYLALWHIVRNIEHLTLERHMPRGTMNVVLDDMADMQLIHSGGSPEDLLTYDEHNPDGDSRTEFYCDFADIIREHLPWDVVAPRLAQALYNHRLVSAGPPNPLSAAEQERLSKEVLRQNPRIAEWLSSTPSK